MDKRYAEDHPYFDTTIAPSKSLSEIQELLNDFSAEAIMAVQGQTAGKYAWMIRFAWESRSYRFLFTPLECRYPTKIRSYKKDRRPNNEQARYQMGRIAVFFVKAILTAAATNPHSLFGFLPDIMPNLPQLGSGDDEIIEGEV